MAKQAGLYRLGRILSYLAAQMVLATSKQQLWDVTDAAVIVNARISDIKLERHHFTD